MEFQKNKEAIDMELQTIVKRLGVEKLEEALYFPQFFQIETTRRCNAKCPFCANGKWDMTEPEMPEDMFDKIVDELSQYKDWVRMVDIQRAGEPLLDNRIAARIRKMKQAGIRFVTISTNASLLDEKTARGLLEAGLDEIMISIDSVEKEEYERLRVGLNFEKVMGNIKAFFKVRDEVKPETIIRVRAVACFDTEDVANQFKIKQFESYWDRWKRDHDRVYMKRLHAWGNQHVWNDCATGYDQSLHVLPCIVPWSTLHVTTMGIVPLCGQDMDGNQNLGNIREQSIKDIWTGDKIQEVRRLHSTGDRNQIQYCRSCRVFDPDFSLEVASHKGYFYSRKTG